MGKQAQPPGKQSDSHGHLKSELVKSATSLFLSKLPPSTLPPEATLRHVAMEVQQHLKSSLAENSKLQALPEAGESQPLSANYIALDFTRWLNHHPLPLVHPTPIVKVSPWKVAVTAAVGAFGGQLLSSTLFRFLIGQPEAGLLWGGPVGALLLVLLLLSPLTQKLGDLFPGLGLNIRRASYDAQSYASTLRSVLEIWIDNALSFLNTMASESQGDSSASSVSAEKKALPLQIGGYLHKLHQSPPQQLADVAASLLVEARINGIEGLDGDPVFISGKAAPPVSLVWTNALEAKYNAIGLIEAGDEAIVEELPLIRDGRILRKGVIRKKRK